ncbi:MAG: hypothetical protein L3J35_11995 [Bacteroidales bacterium]|nr:hypothetical protein [Bacteroidales bacterium]
MPLQIRRPLILFAVIIILFLTARHFLTPESFGEKGFYRGNALEENMDREIRHTGDKSCFECHDDKIAERDSSVHISVKCEVCHGPGYKHILSGEANDIEKPDGVTNCKWCHTKNAARPTTVINQIDIQEHLIDNGAEKCIECHENPHNPIIQ